MRIINLVPIITVFLVGCGGGSGDSSNGGGAPTPPSQSPPNVLSGQFKDSNVEGLTYATATQSDTTNARGTFNFLSGENIEFSIGGVVLGSSKVKSTMTPIDLIAGGSSTDTSVTNITRFLMLLDQNGVPEDGITISGAVRNIADNWTQVDFASASFDNDIATIISDVASVDSRAAALPNVQSARSHLESTERCLMSGLFYGTYSGMRSGEIYFLVYPTDGRIVGAFADSIADYESIAPATIDRQQNFRLEVPGNSNDYFEGQFESFHQLSGVWTIGQDHGTFAATREILDADAAYRYTGEWHTNNVKHKREGVAVFNVDDDGAFDGIGPRVNGARYRTFGQINAPNIQMGVEFADTEYSGTVDDDLYATLAGMNSNGGTILQFFEGCRLN